MEKYQNMPVQNRRHFLKSLAGSATLLAAPRLAWANLPAQIRTKVIPATGEKIPVVGMGTWLTFDVEGKRRADNCTEVLKTFFKLGGGMVDSSPMYGEAEAVMGYCLKKLGKPQPRLFSATKVWHMMEGMGKRQIEKSFILWGIDRFDLFQIHNLLGFKKHIDTLRGMKKEGRIKYLGVTTSHGRRHDDLEDILKSVPMDFVQLTYNIVDREVEHRLLPLAKDRGVAVIANRPFQGGNLFSKYASQPLPEWAREFDCRNWAQFFLKFIVAHPAVTCAIPATSQVKHMRENMGALQGELPDAKTQERMIHYVAKM